jgi:hypothetical protein
MQKINTELEMNVKNINGYIKIQFGKTMKEALKRRTRDITTQAGLQ